MLLTSSKRTSLDGPQLQALRRKVVEESGADVPVAHAGNGMAPSASTSMLASLRNAKRDAAPAVSEADAAADAADVAKREAASSHGKRNSLVDRLRETRQHGQSKTMLRNEMEGATRADLEYTLHVTSASTWRTRPTSSG